MVLGYKNVDIIYTMYLIPPQIYRSIEGSFNSGVVYFLGSILYLMVFWWQGRTIFCFNILLIYTLHKNIADLGWIFLWLPNVKYFILYQRFNFCWNFYFKLVLGINNQLVGV